MKFNALARLLKWGLLTGAVLVMVSCGYESPTQPTIVDAPRVELTPAPAAPVPVVTPLTMTMSSGRQDPKAGDGLSLTAHLSSGATLPVTYTWAFGDGTASNTTTDSFAGHAYARRGDYAATVRRATAPAVPRTPR